MEAKKACAKCGWVMAEGEMYYYDSRNYHALCQGCVKSTRGTNYLEERIYSSMGDRTMKLNVPPRQPAKPRTVRLAQICAGPHSLTGLDTGGTAWVYMGNQYGWKPLNMTALTEAEAAQATEDKFGPEKPRYKVMRDNNIDWSPDEDLPF